MSVNDDDDLIGDAPGPGHNSGDSYRVVAAELRQFIEWIERLQAEKRDIADQEREVFAEAKARGYDTAAMRKIISERRQAPDQISEQEAVLLLYRQALGMAG